MEDWIYNYRLGKLNLLKGDHQSAYLFSIKCWEILRDTFNIVDIKDQLYLLELFYKTAHLAKSSLEKKGCKTCVEKQLTTALESYKMISTSQYYCDVVKEKSKVFIEKIQKDILDFYIVNKMDGRKKTFDKEIRKNHLKLIYGHAV